MHYEFNDTANHAASSFRQPTAQDTEKLPTLLKLEDSEGLSKPQSLPLAVDSRMGRQASILKLSVSIGYDAKKFPTVMFLKV
jgi:hypothetical protein